MKDNQKGMIPILIVLVIVAILTYLGYYLYIQRKQPGVTAVPSAYQAQYNESGNSVTPINDNSDLTSASASLDATDTTELDTQLNAFNSASSGF